MNNNTTSTLLMIKAGTTGGKDNDRSCNEGNEESDNRYHEVWKEKVKCWLVRNGRENYEIPSQNGEDTQKEFFF